MNSLEEVFIALVEAKANSKNKDILISEEIKNYCQYVDRVRVKSLVKRLEILPKSQYRKSKGTSSSKVNHTSRKSSIVGKVFEEIVAALFKESAMFSYTKNKKSSVSEFDLIINIHDPYRAHFKIFDGADKVFAECKCYTSSPTNSWITKLTGVMNVHNTDFGLIFVYWDKKKAPDEFSEMIWRQYHKGLHSFKIIPFGITQLEDIINGKSFVNVLETQFGFLDMEMPFHL